MTQQMTRKHWPRGTWMKLISKDTLRALMAQKGLSLAEVADSAKVSRGFISHLTAGRKTTCKPRTAVAIARRLDVPLELLFVPSVSSDSGTHVYQQKRAA